MSFKVTTKSVKENYGMIFAVGYCEMQYLLMPFKRVAYTSGIYGWNYDVYEPFNDGVAICTGYRSMPGGRLENIEKYEGEACKVWNDLDTSHENKMSKIGILLKKLLEENSVC